MSDVLTEHGATEDRLDIRLAKQRYAEVCNHNVGDIKRGDYDVNDTSSVSGPRDSDDYCDAFFSCSSISAR